ncbi:MAG: nucleotidyltransferase domain-containing protein [Candidatus Omnitrophica bacterium]|nr:nucleotidyltransferase domain-containing protein [Candidatus Omnitrophota bacterium]
MKYNTMEDLKEKIREFCEKSGIIFVYLFGSSVEDQGNLSSDLDIGIYLEDPEGICLLELHSEFSKIFCRDKIDIVVLNKVSLLMQFKIIQKGKLIYCQDELKRIRYETKIMSLYHDRRYYYKRHIQRSLERIAKEGIL